MRNLTQAIQHWATTRYGLVIPDYQINQQIQRLMAKHNMTEESYLEALQSDQQAIVHNTIDALTIQESYFFRDSYLFLYLKNTLLPHLIQRKRTSGDLTLNVWSAGCASGEEIYSVAIYLDQLLPDIEQWKINLIATDINQFSLDKGKKGLFTQSSLRVTDNETIRNYFETQTAPFILKQKIRDRVQFEYGNLAEINHKPFHYDLIFCRNVFIYLDRDTILRALKTFYDALVNDGILFLGPADLVTYLPHQFSIEIIQDLYLLKKKVPLTTIVEPKPTVQSPPHFSYMDQPKEQTTQLKAIQKLLDNKQFCEALEKINDYLSTYKETALLYRYKGEALIGLDDMANASIYLTKSIKLDQLDATSHYLLGMVELDMKNNLAAIVSFQKAIYIKPNFPEATYHLGLLYLQKNQWYQGITTLKQSLGYAKKQPKEKLVLCTNGTFEQLIQAINASIHYYQGQEHER